MKGQLPSPRLDPQFAVLIVLLVSLLTFSACAPGTTGGDGYEAQIRRTSYGIAHITAADIGSLGFGEGYAQAEDHLCSVADQVVKARGERAKFFGAGEDDRHLRSDVTMKALRVHERAAADFATMADDVKTWYQGYVDGYNKYLEETTVDNVAGWCQGEPWVFPISTTDLAAYHRVVTITSPRFADQIATAQPPGGGPVTSAAVELTEPETASNGWGLGSERSAAGRGMLIANPHYPWIGSNRFWEKHLTIPGELDAYGVGLIGIPGVAIGFNDAVAWTHTVSAGDRFTLYSLDLVEGNPTRYRYGDDERDMTAELVSVEVKQDGGSSSTHEQQVWFSHYGPVVNFPNVGWSEQLALTLRDANEDNDEGRQQWLAMDRAKSLDEFKQAHATYQGMPWVNTISTSAEGIAWYVDSSSTPNLSDEALASWNERRGSDPLTKAMDQRSIVLLDGSNPANEWIDDSNARDGGIVAFEDMPQLERRDYVFNANDSYWLANSAELVTGYSPLHGGEQTARSMRTRMNDTTLSDLSSDGPAGDDGVFTLDELGEAILSNRSFTAATLRAELVERCQGQSSVTVDGNTVDLTEACSVLASWDGRYDLDSRGAVLFREWITRYDGDDLSGAGKLFAVDFDPADPVGTPNTLAPGALALENLGHAVSVLAGQGLALDVPLGEVQFAYRGGQRIPIHGGNGGYEGIENFVRYHANDTTLEPINEYESVEGSALLKKDGYPVNSGTSFLMALEYTDDGPRAKAFLTYSQSGDPSSEHYYDQTVLYSKKQWRPILFSEEDVAADTKRSYEVRGPRSGS